MKKSLVLTFMITGILHGTPRSESQDKTAIIIGGSSGIASKIAKVLAENNYYVGLVGRHVERLQKVQSTIDHPTHIHCMDISNVAETQEELPTLIEEMGGCIDLCIISVGAWSEMGSGLLPSNKKISWSRQQTTIDVNVTGFSIVANLVINQFIQQGFGHLVGISSIDCLRGVANYPVYAASKAYISSYLHGMRYKFEYLRMPILITEVRPGYVDTHNMRPDPYWVATAEQAANDIYDAICKKKRLVYVTKRWYLIALLMHFSPAAITNRLLGY